MSDYIHLVKSTIDHLWNKANQYAPTHTKYSEQRQRTYRELVERFKELLVYIEELKTFNSSRSDTAKVGKRFGDLSDIPKELLEEAKIGLTDALDEQILNIIDEDFGGIAGIDEIFIQMFRKHKKHLKRQFLVNKMGRMTRKGLIVAEKGRKGIYMIKEYADAKITS